ncbi:MAG: tetratricopeptide repeat protein [Candidatus Wallbacteria bacterium]|nr:tetratricopeptide repeat protein [Candidatus Wallbacteria bacterium]
MRWMLLTSILFAVLASAEDSPVLQRSTEHLIKAYENASFDDKIPSLKEFCGQTDEASVNFLEKIVQSSDEAEKITALLVLWKIENPKAIQVLRIQAAGKDPIASSVALINLLRIKDREAPEWTLRAFSFLKQPEYDRQLGSLKKDLRFMQIGYCPVLQSFAMNLHWLIEFGAEMGITIPLDLARDYADPEIFAKLYPRDCAEKSIAEASKYLAGKTVLPSRNARIMKALAPIRLTGYKQIVPELIKFLAQKSSAGVIALDYDYRICDAVFQMIAELLTGRTVEVNFKSRTRADRLIAKMEEGITKHGLDYQPLLSIDDQICDLLEEGTRLIDTGDLDSGIRQLDSALVKDAGLSEAYGVRGWARLQNRNTVEAIADFDKAISLSPEYSDAFQWRGIAELKEGKGEEAFQDFSTARRLEPDNLLHLYYMSTASLFNKEFEEAVDLATQFIDKNEIFMPVFQVRADAYRELGQLEKALNDANQALAGDPGNPAFFKTRAQIYGKMGKTGQEKADLESARKSGGN